MSSAAFCALQALTCCLLPPTSPSLARALSPLSLTLSLPSEGGFFKCELRFPEDFPNKPPAMFFLSEMWHPNSECSVQRCSLRTA
jgi:hypothetical protein